MKLMALSSRPTLPPHTGARAVDTARQGLNAKIWIPKRAIFPRIEVLDLYNELVPALLDHSVQNPPVLPKDLQPVLDAILKMYRASIDWFINNSAIDENIPEEDFKTYFRTFWEEFDTVISPVTQIHLDHAEPNTTLAEENAVSSSPVNGLPLLELGTPQTPHKHVTMTIRSRPNVLLQERLIGLKIDVGLEEDDDSKIIRITGHTENNSPISEHIRSSIEKGLHATSVQSEVVGRVQFWDTSDALIPNPKFESEE
jgi:hypothetical protein